MSAHQAEDYTQELIQARKIQMGMLPQSVPKISGFQIAAHSSPAVAVGGDFYDFIQLGDNKMGIVIGDAVGHGIAAALLMTMTLTDFRSMAPRYVSAAEVLNSVNRRLMQCMQTRAFVTSIYAVLDRTSNRLTCAMAGMQPLLIKAKSGECISIEPSDLPLGASRKIQYQSSSVQMEMGDTLVLYTDGIPESVNENDEFYSFERLEKTLAENSGADAQELLDAVITDVRQFSGDHPQEDDITMVALKATESLAVAPVVSTSRLITGERRPVTMLMAVGDDELPLPVVEKVNALMREHGSIVDALGDDTIVALFGVPTLHEDDAERAVTAAQAIQGLDIPITFRTGIDTGAAIIRSDEDIDYHEMGGTMRRALHLANDAEPGQVLVSEETHQLTRGAFQFASVAQIQPSEDESISAYPVVAQAEQPHRARGIQGLHAPMIGREREMEQLTASIDDLLNGRGQIVSITGEAGIGKTRLVSELKQYAGDQVQWLEGRCISYGQAMNYGPFRGIFSSFLGILPTDTEEEMKAKLQGKVDALLPPRGKWNPIHVGSIFFPQYEAELRTASGDDYAKQYTYPILRNLFQKIAEQKPLVLVFEDLHWSDPTSLALLEFLIESVDEAPILYVWLYRPYRDSGCWRLREHANREFNYCNLEIDLSPLPDEQTDTLVSELLHIPDIPENMRTLVQDKASGNPLYVEEIIRSFIDEEAVIRDAEHWRATVESAGIVPSDTLQGVILERVDGLEPDAKETLQIAAVVGEHFPLALLEQVIESESLSSSLRNLERAQMLQRRRVGDDWEYNFYHPLIYDVVYHSLLPEDRASLHEKTGAIIESMHSDRLDDYTDILAHHYGCSNNIEKALHYLTLAGEKATKLASYWEALDYYDKAMEKAKGLPDSRHKRQILVDLVLKRTGPRHMLGASRRDVEEHDEYLEWVEELDDREKIQLYYGWAASHSSYMGDVARLEFYGQKVANMRDLPSWLSGRDHSMIIDSFHAVQYFGSEDFQAHVSLIQKVDVSTDFSKIDPQSAVFRSIVRAKVHCLMGQWNESLKVSHAALELAAESSQGTAIIWARAGLGGVYRYMGDWKKAIDECQSALDMSPSNLLISWIITPLGEAYCKSCQLDRGLSLLEHWLAYTRRIGEVEYITECKYCLPLAEGYLAKGDIGKALENANRALEIARMRKYPVCKALAHRILGEILASTDFPLAEDHFSRSLEIMQRIKARNEEGKTELSWGRACQQHGDIEQAKAHLNRAAEIFEELGTTRYLEWTQEAIAELEN